MLHVGCKPVMSFIEVVLRSAPNDVCMGSRIPALPTCCDGENRYRPAHGGSTTVRRTFVV